MPTTPQVEAERQDKGFASAFKELEGPISDLRMMASLLELVAAETVLRPETKIESDHKARAFIADCYRLHLLTTEQDEAFEYAVNHTADLIRSLGKQWNAMFDAAVEASKAA